MSHPWKPQPYYMYREPRTTGTVPAAMGLGNVYARGSFAAKSPWNVPQYIASQPTGLNGFGAFGQTEDCLPRAEVEALIKAGVSAGLAQVGSFEVAGVKVSAAPLAGLISNFVMQQVVSLSQSGANVQGAMKKVVTDAIADATGVPLFLVSIGVNELTGALVNVSRICAQPTAPTGLTLDVRLKNCKQALVIRNSADYDYSTKMFAEQQYVANKCDEIMTAPIQLTAEEGRALMQRATQRTTTIARLTAPLTALRVVPPPSPAYAAESKGISPIMLGAAAIAALLLLR